MSEPRLVNCRKLHQLLPGLDRAPYRNDLGKRIYEEVSKDAWEMWKKDSVKFINTYRVDLTTSEGQKFMFDQCAIYFSLGEGDAAPTAWVPPESASSQSSNDK